MVVKCRQIFSLKNVTEVGIEILHDLSYEIEIDNQCSDVASDT